MNIKSYLLVVLCLGSTALFCQSVTIEPGSRNSKQKLEGNLEVKSKIESRRDGVSFGDGTNLTTANQNPVFPHRHFSLPILARFRNPNIQGEVTSPPAFANQVELYAANFDLERNATGAYTSGPKVFRPFVIKKSLDKASLGIMHAYNINQDIEEIIITIRQVNASMGQGAEGNPRFVYVLNHARVIDVRHIEMLDENGVFYISEEVRLTYQSIEIRDLLNNTDVFIDGVP